MRIAIEKVYPQRLSKNG